MNGTGKCQHISAETVPPVRRKRVLQLPGPVIWTDPDESNPDSSVYFLYSGGKIKIGSTRNVAYRHGALAGASPLPVYCVCLFTGGRATERKFHERFKADRLHGEWFTLSDEMRWLISQEGAGLELAEAEFKKWLLEQKP
jgi:Meiotically up-regulated gene 113